MVTLPDSSRRYSTSSSAPCRAQNHLSSPGNHSGGARGTCLHLLLDLVDEAEHDRLRHAVRQVAPHKVEVRRHELPCDINPESITTTRYRPCCTSVPGKAGRGAHRSCSDSVMRPGTFAEAGTFGSEICVAFCRFCAAFAPASSPKTF